MEYHQITEGLSPREIRYLCGLARGRKSYMQSTKMPAKTIKALAARELIRICRNGAIKITFHGSRWAEHYATSHDDQDLVRDIRKQRDTVKAHR